MNRLQVSLLAALLMGGGVLMVAQAAEPTQQDPHYRPSAPEWSGTDTNRDGYLTKEELMAYPGVLEVFEKIDTDRDGRISEAEYSYWYQNVR